MPQVSVIIPAYNQSQYLGDAMRSVLAQTCQDLEIVVVDDGSTDETRAVATSFADPRVRYYYQANRGLAGARNTGIRHARGSFLAYLDSDDILLPDGLRILLDTFETSPQLGFVAGQTVVVDETGRRVSDATAAPLPEDSSDLLLGNPMSVGSMLIRREWQDRAGFFDERLRSYEDWDMWLRLARAGCPMGWVRRPIFLYRFHAAQMTRLADQMTTATFAVLDNVYRQPDLPETWQQRRDEAYSRAFLRAAAQAFTSGTGLQAREHLREATRLDPRLCADGAELLARIVAGWANYAKTSDPMTFLEHVYDNLPDELQAMRRRKRRDLARQASQMGFAALEKGDAAAARSYLWSAVAYRPGLLFNRGVLSVLFRPRRPQVTNRGTTRLSFDEAAGRSGLAQRGDS